jgi:DNA-binding PadR family transcriptional regulator
MGRHEPPDHAGTLLPLKPVVFQVLLTLAAGERHGYAIVQDMTARSAIGRPLLPGNLYRTLSWMLTTGLIEESSRRPAAELDDERRRYYRITPFGLRVAGLEASRLRALVAEAEALKLVKKARHA